jgi:hypothetical protein
MRRQYRVRVGGESRAPKGWAFEAVRLACYEPGRGACGNRESAGVARTSSGRTSSTCTGSATRSSSSARWAGSPTSPSPSRRTAGAGQHDRPLPRIRPSRVPQLAEPPPRHGRVHEPRERALGTRAMGSDGEPGRARLGWRHQRSLRPAPERARPLDDVPGRRGALPLLATRRPPPLQGPHARRRGRAPSHRGRRRGRSRLRIRGVAGEERVARGPRGPTGRGSPPPRTCSAGT